MLFDDDEELGQCVDLGVRMLDVFLSKVPLPRRVLGVEVPFALGIADPLTGRTAVTMGGTCPPMAERRWL